MMTMIEQVAHALWLEDANRAAPNVAKYRTEKAFKDAISPGEREAWINLATAAIKAIREPTDQMVDNGQDARLDGGGYYDIWRAMIDTVLRGRT